MAAPAKKTDAIAKPGGGGVKFQDQVQQPSSIQPEPIIEKKLQYKNAQFCAENAIRIFNEMDTQFRVFTKNDPEVKRKDTAKALLKILDTLKSAMELMNIGTFDDKMKNYYLTYNGTIYIFDICQYLRKSVYSSLTIDYLAFCILSLECHLILMGVKFLEWRVKLYVELAHVYEELESLNAASKTIDVALKKVLEIKELEESDPPLVDYMKRIFENSFRILRVLELKFKVQVLE